MERGPPLDITNSEHSRGSHGLLALQLEAEARGSQGQGLSEQRGEFMASLGSLAENLAQ